MVKERLYLPEGFKINSQENIGLIQSMSGIEKAMNEGIVLEAVANLCDLNHNLIIDFGFAKGIIPREDAAIGIDTGATKEIAIISRVGKPISFKVININYKERKPIITLSRKKAQLEALDFFMNTLDVGQVVSARITHLETFGAFVDLGCGIISLIGIENISISRIFHPKERFSENQDIYAVVQNIDHSAQRISLSHKELLGTWDENASKFNAGETIRGIIRSIEPYGIFVELTPNLSGLAENKPGIFKGQEVSVYIKSIIPERMKIKLSIIDSVKSMPSAPYPLEYFIKSGKIDRWIYTPDVCKNKIIISDYNGNK